MFPSAPPACAFAHGIWKMAVTRTVGPMREAGKGLVGGWEAVAMKEKVAVPVPAESETRDGTEVRGTDKM